MIEFRFDGQPIPQGSMKVINGHVIHSQGSALAAWRSGVALAAQRAGAKPSLNPIAITMVFVVRRPKTVTRKEPTVPPDLDKLVRAVLDGLTSVAYHDDAQVTEIHTAKIYGDSPGVEVRIVEKPQ